MLLLTSTSDIVRVVTGSAGAIDVHASWVDNAAGTITPGRTNTASITTATTTTVVAAPAASTQRNVRLLVISNEGAASNLITIEHFDGTTAETIWKGNLLAGERMIFDDQGDCQVYDANGLLKVGSATKVFNQSTAAVSSSFAADTYLAGSFIVFPQTPKIGTRYRCDFDLTKTAAGTATPIIQVRTGTAGTTADTSRCSFTFGAGTAAAETAKIRVEGYFRSVGSGTSAVFVATCSIVNLAATGVASTVKALTTVSAGFDSTTAGLGIGLSVNGGTGFVGSNNLVMAEVENF